MTRLTKNDRRALRIGHILTWCKDWDSGREGLIDLLTDARHWCDRNGESFDILDRIADQHYVNERHSIEGNAP